MTSAREAQSRYVGWESVLSEEAGEELWWWTFQERDRASLVRAVSVSDGVWWGEGEAFC